MLKKFVIKCKECNSQNIEIQTNVTVSCLCNQSTTTLTCKDCESKETEYAED